MIKNITIHDTLNDWPTKEWMIEFLETSFAPPNSKLVMERHAGDKVEVSLTWTEIS